MSDESRPCIVQGELAAFTDAVSEPTTWDHTGVATEMPPAGYLERKLGGWCTYGACTRRAAEGVQLCSQHRARVNTKQRKRVAKQRAELSEQGKCRRCRKPSKTYRCPGCKILDGGNLPTTGDHTGVATTADPWRKDGDGWARYRGKGRRGAPGAAINDAQDLGSALDAFEKGRHALIYARSAQVQALGRIARRDALSAALSQLALAARFIDEVVDRNKPRS